LQRCASLHATACDLADAAALGGVAVRAAAAGETGVMPAIRREGNSPYLVSYGLADVSAVANAERRVPAAWIREDGMDVTSDFADYVRPLVAGEVAPLFVDGLPLHVEPLA
ncbi:6-phosphofructokinase, partial [Atopobiaceae bacterium LCP21S3_F7]